MEAMGMTQTSFAKQLGIAWSSVNAWEMGVSAPSMQHIVKLAHIFKVSTDYLLGVDPSASGSVEGLTEKDIQIINGLIVHLKKEPNKESNIV